MSILTVDTTFDIYYPVDNELTIEISCETRYRQTSKTL